MFMHEKYSSPTRTPGPGAGGGNDAAMVILTENKVFSMADEEDSD